MARKIAYEQMYRNITFYIRKSTLGRHVLAKFAGCAARRLGDYSQYRAKTRVRKHTAFAWRAADVASDIFRVMV